MDPCSVLQLGQAPTPEEVRGAYLRLARQWHPDRCNGSGLSRADCERRFKSIEWAYRRLRERHRRDEIGRRCSLLVAFIVCCAGLYSGPSAAAACTVSSACICYTVVRTPRTRLVAWSGAAAAAPPAATSRWPGWLASIFVVSTVLGCATLDRDAITFGCCAILATCCVAVGPEAVLRLLARPLPVLLCGSGCLLLLCWAPGWAPAWSLYFGVGLLAGATVSYPRVRDMIASGIAACRSVLSRSILGLRTLPTLRPPSMSRC
eukprot:TRINITY_DN19429_c0_g1_i1.p1 TRINITY_DN19429_c0_g1~~TRINITY_DN19429_c0_g1_i1.p1  ORF type:complete len:262 (+),score=22.26 TRINITY_DN19429_c0_g1_i1:53-838(+)